MKRVKVITPVKFFYGGKFRTLNDEFDYDGEMKPFLQVVQKTTKEPVKVEKQIVPEPDFEKTEEGSEIITTFDPGMAASPAAIKAMVQSAESGETVEPPVNTLTEETVENSDEENVPTPKLEMVEAGRGWFEIADEDGNIVSAKKMRKAEAEEALAALQS